jgi:hypothetical protein
MEDYLDDGGLSGGGRGAGSNRDDDDNNGTMGLYAGSGEGTMGLKADAGTILKIAGDAGCCDGDSDASEDGRMVIEGDAGGGDGDYGESGTSDPDGLDLDLSGRDACGGGSDGDGSEDGRMGLEADSGAVLEAEGGADGNDCDASEDGRMGIEGDADSGDGNYGESGTSGPDGLDLDLSGRDACDDSEDVSKVEEGAGDRGATKDTHTGTPRGLRSAAGKRERNYNRARRRRAALERRALQADGPANENAAGP